MKMSNRGRRAIYRAAGGVVVSMGLLAALPSAASAAATGTFFDAAYISSDSGGKALTPDYVNNQVSSYGSGTYLAPISVFGTGDLDPDPPGGTHPTGNNGDHIANRMGVGQDGANAVPTDLLSNTNQQIAPNPGGGGAGGESIDYELGNSNTNVVVTGSGSAVNHGTFNAIDNSATGGRRRLVANFDARGANTYGDTQYPLIGHIGWQFLTGGTDMQSSPEALTITPSWTGSYSSVGEALPSLSGTSGLYAWYGIQGGHPSTTSDIFTLATSTDFDQKWRVTGLGFVAGDIASAHQLIATFTLSDNSQTVITLSTGTVSTDYFQENTTGEMVGGEIFAGLDLGALPGNLSIKSVTFSTSRYNTGPLFVDDLAVILSPVPEPGALGLCVIGAGLLAMRRRSRKCA